MKTVLLFVLAGALMGVIAASLIGTAGAVLVYGTRRSPEGRSHSGGGGNPRGHSIRDLAFDAWSSDRRSVWRGPRTVHRDFLRPEE